ncbi:beta-ketoacyl synthase N-terminal-like domain-containing protein, partial [Chitinophaga sp. 22536]|uniref:beta-ketoacyl synthase N-terminal-like domain-containing protein n=1 Tax=unclassified Chitinophaga TaxID=2619133 RepID=UPI003F84F58A
MENRTVHIEMDANNFILRDHKVYGISILPGVNYIELVLRAAKAMFGDVYRVKKMLFLEPLAVADGCCRDLEITFTNVAAGNYAVSARSAEMPTAGQPAGAWTEHMRCHLEPFDKQGDQVFDVKGFIASSERVLDMSEGYKWARSVSIFHGPFMQTKGAVYQRKDEELMALQLGEEAAEYLKELALHPAFLDGATFAGISFNLAGSHPWIPAGTDPYIPFSIESFEWHRPFPGKIFVHSHKPVLPFGKAPEVVKNNIAVYDEEGHLLARFYDITSKRIRHPEMIRKLVETPAMKEIQTAATTVPVSSPPVKEETITHYLRQLVGNKTGKPVPEADISTGFYELGLDSKGALEIVRELERLYKTDLYPTLLFEYQNIKDLGDYLSQYQVPADIDQQTAVRKENPEPLSLLSELPVVAASGTGMGEPVAIIGVSGKYPGAKNIHAFWDNLKAGKDCITEIPPDRWDADSAYNAGNIKSKWGGFLTDIDKFDAEHFRIPPVLAELLDPQIRLFMEVVWATFEDAGWKPMTYPERRIGVFVGSMFNDYPLLATEKPTLEKLSFYTHWAIANRVSYHYGLTGPSIAVNTACSSSLTAIIQACDAIRKGDCVSAIAGGVNLNLHASRWQILGEIGFLGTATTSKSFAAGDGYLPGEGVGAVLLKSLKRAEADGDRIYGVIRSEAVNHDGRSGGFGVPNPGAQALLINESLKRAQIDPFSINYIEAAANGSPLGDPIEIAGLSRVFHERGENNIVIGAVKSNIGHLEAASGISQLTKVILQLQHRQLAPTIGTEKLNPDLHLERTPFKINTTLQEWLPTNGLRRAMISSFGAGGSNAHIIVDDYTGERVKRFSGNGESLIVLSAHTINILREQTIQLKSFLQNNDGISLYDLAYTLQTGREAMEERWAIVVHSMKELVAALEAFPENKPLACYGDNNSGNDEAGPSAIQVALNNGDLNLLACAWLKGATIDWTLLYPDDKPQKIGLPTYPFAGERYWIPVGQPRYSSVQEENGEKTFFYNHVWKAKAITEMLSQAAAEDLLLVSGGPATLAEKLGERLEMRAVH